MSREFFRFDLTDAKTKRSVSVFAHHIEFITELLDKDTVVGSRLHLMSGTTLEVTQVREAIFKMDHWQIFKKAGAM